jgi:hypothetical protein
VLRLNNFAGKCPRRLEAPAAPAPRRVFFCPAIVASRNAQCARAAARASGALRLPSHATRGKPPRRAKDVRRLVVDKRREHSRKPDCIRERIERLIAGPYLELFARETKPGWDCWGAQVALFNQGPVTTRRQPSRLTDAPQLPL